MKHLDFLREFSKFAAGLVAADLIVGIWLYLANLLPMNFLGLMITPNIAIAGIIFDLFLMLLLIHYGWHTSLSAPSIHEKTLLNIVGVLLSIVAILHLLRLIFGLTVNIAGWEAPMWLSWIGTIATGYLGYTSIRFGSQK